MKIKHLLGTLALVALVLAIGCGGGTLGLQNVNSTQVYTTAGYTIDSIEHQSAPATAK
jgi:hypothetical protein